LRTTETEATLNTPHTAMTTFTLTDEDWASQFAPPTEGRGDAYYFGLEDDDEPSELVRRPKTERCEGCGQSLDDAYTAMVIAFEVDHLPEDWWMGGDDM